MPNGKNSSGGSSNAENWFEDSNNEVREQSKGFNDNDPPFFMRNSSSSQTPPDGRQQHLQRFVGNDAARSLPHRTGMLRLGTDGSSTEDFRGVIDDLTVENKKLKRRLKQYEKLHDSHLKDEKLFEIRVHGLAVDKKRELEELLRKFAGNLNKPPGFEFPANGYEGIVPGLKSHKTASSLTSLHNNDSAYASMSASGQGSSQGAGDAKPKNVAQYAKSRQQNIQSYLHHIPEGLMPHENPAHMSERAKKKMVVNRLEQIFAGKGALAGPHYQALQQQDVSQMAAHADRTAGQEQGRPSVREGHREAPIMQRETEDPTDPATMYQVYQTESLNYQEGEKVGEHDFAGHSPKNSSPDQRPTRPLDLDPDRAQVPSDNLRYIRHLGFSPKDPESQQTYEEGHGWVYLNLLVNMAQLHTINVTSDFVRKALTEYSDHFELSADGRKVRWSGGAAMTRTSSQAGYTDPRVDDTQSPRKRVKLCHPDSIRSRAPTGLQRRGGSSVLQQENNKLMYTPLFHHRSGTEDSDDSSDEDEDTMSSDFPQPIGGDLSSAMTSSGVRTTSTKKHKKRDNGPIIFYNNARFCTDLSGDPEANGNPRAPPYKLSTVTPIGKPQPTTTERMLETRGPLDDAKQLPEPMDLSDNPIPDSLELSFPPPSSPRSETNSEDFCPIPLEVTGMGGIYPADNFAIAVESRHARVDQTSAPTVSVQTASKNIPARFAKIFEEGNPNRQVRGAVNQQVLKVKHIEHPPSKLPPALCFMPLDEDSDEESEAGADMSLSPPSPGAFPPSTAPQAIEMPDADSDDSDDSMSDADSVESDAGSDGSDGSLDLLAAARAADPEAIRQKEREYDAEMAERLAEEIPAGSSAATAGGGSGFASPASGVDAEEYRQAKRNAAALRQPQGLKRARTSDSMIVQGMAGSQGGAESVMS